MLSYCIVSMLSYRMNVSTYCPEASSSTNPATKGVPCW